MFSVSPMPQEVAQPSSFDAAPVVTTSTTCSEWWHNPPTPSERTRFQIKTVEEAPPEGSGVETPCLLWTGGRNSTGVPRFKYRGQYRTANAVHAHFLGFRPEDNQMSYCGRQDCLSHRHASAEKRSRVTQHNDKTVREVLPLELSDWDGFQVHRADGADCTGDMVCYCCGGERTPGNTFRVTKVDGLIVSVTKVFDPITSQNDTICDGCWDEGVPVTRGTHLMHEGSGYGLRNNGGPTKIRDMENLLIASIDAGLPMELVVGCTSVADRIVEVEVAELKEDLHNLWLNADYESFVGTSEGHELRGYPADWQGVADPAHRQRFIETMDKVHEAVSGRPRQRMASEGDNYKPLSEEKRKKYQTSRTPEEIEAYRAKKRSPMSSATFDYYEPDEDGGLFRTAGPFPAAGADAWPRFLKQSIPVMSDPSNDAVITREFGTWKKCEEEKPPVSTEPPVRLNAESALVLSLELSNGRKPKPEYRAVEFADYTHSPSPEAPCHHCGALINPAALAVNHPCFRRRVNRRKKV